MQLKQALSDAISRLTTGQVPSPRMNAELLLMFTLNADRAHLYAHPERELTPDEQGRYNAALAERARGVPAQYITGHQEFWGMDFIVTPAVLIPRPETEHVIETVLELLASDVGSQTSDPRPPTSDPRPPTSDLRPSTSNLRPQTPDLGLQTSDFRIQASTSEPRRPGAGSRKPSAQVRGPRSEVRRQSSEVRIADIGTGSGCIALALAKEIPWAEIHATDISPAALEVSRANAARHQLESRVHFHPADLLTGLALAPLDFVVSNPPYVGDSEEDQVQLEVRKFEPRNAVFAGPKGTELIERLIPQAHRALKPGGWLVMEISGTIVKGVKRLLPKWEDVQIRPDLQSIPRVVQARKPLAKG